MSDMHLSSLNRRNENSRREAGGIPASLDVFDRSVVRSSIVGNRASKVSSRMLSGRP
jgi:hypothetical protein